MRNSLIIIALLLGCGDSSPPAAPGRNPDLPSEPIDTGPNVLELACDELTSTESGIFFYAESEAPSWEFDAFYCTAGETPFAPATCTTTNYVIEDGFVRVLCSQWQPEAQVGDYLADFVRIERKLS